MNLVGKIFVFLIFCMSAAFMAMSVAIYAAHTNWMEEVIRPKEEGNLKLGYMHQLVKANQKNAELVKDKEALAAKLIEEKVARRQLVTKLEEQVAIANAQRDAAIQEKMVAVKAQQKALDDLAIEQADLSALHKKIDAQRDLNKEAYTVVDVRFAEARKYSELANQLQSDLRRANERNEALTNDLALWERVGKDLHVDKFTQVNRATSLVLDGIVTAVKRSGEDTYAQISIGSDDGLQKGDKLEVFRGDKYIGRVQVVRTTPNKSVAQMIREDQKAPMMPRDRVETKASLKVN